MRPHDIDLHSLDRDLTPLAPTADDQLARDIAEIERAAAALRHAEPRLETASSAPAPALGQSQSVWLIIGVLWISTALATLGAVFAIAALVG